MYVYTPDRLAFGETAMIVTLASVLDYVSSRINQRETNPTPHLREANRILLDPTPSLSPGFSSPCCFSKLPELTYGTTIASVPFPGVSKFIISPRYLTPQSSQLLNSDDCIYHALLLLSAQLATVEALYSLHQFCRKV